MTCQSADKLFQRKSTGQNSHTRPPSEPSGQLLPTGFEFICGRRLTRRERLTSRAKWEVFGQRFFIQNCVSVSAMSCECLEMLEHDRHGVLAKRHWRSVQALWRGLKPIPSGAADLRAKWKDFGQPSFFRRKTASVFLQSCECLEVLEHE